MTDVVERDVVVVGAGQAGLSAAYYLLRRGLDFEVLDANDGPGGAWRHRPDSLTFAGAHGLHDLPGFPLETPDPAEPASAVVARYYGAFERRFDLPVRRPVRLTQVTSDDGPQGPLTLHTDVGTWRVRVLVNSTGTWDSPHWPYYPGRESFAGRHVHTRDLRDESELAGLRVVVVGAGTSAVQLLLRLQGRAASTTWVTRRPPQWTQQSFDTEWGRAVEEFVNERTSAGLPPLSVVAATGLPLTAEYRAGIESGVLVSHGPLERIEPGGVVLASGESVPADVIVWATGYRASISHLASLRLREPGGGIRTDGVHVLRDPRVLLVGYGASASTIGATRAGRRAALAAAKILTAGRASGS